MDIKKLQSIVIDALEDVKAQDIKMFDTTGITSLFDRVCIASGTSNRQTKALASSVREKVKEKGGQVLSVEGEDVGEWVLVDLGDMVVHIMQPVIRGYYRLEELWGAKEVKLGAAKRTVKTKVVEETEPPKRVRSNINQAIQTTVDEAVTKPARKPRAKVSAEVGVVTKPKAKSAPRKKAIGTTIKVAASKTAVASAKKASVKRATTKRKVSPAT